jgi:hypothetical protein
MSKLLSPLAIAGVILSLSWLGAAPAEALSTVTFVSGKGTNSGTCTELHPCRTFQFALGQTSPSGEIKAVDPADYGPMTITKSISITGGEGAGIDSVPAGQNAIIITAGSKDVINLSYLTIDGKKAASSGIVLNSGGSLTVTHCTLWNFLTDGMELFGTTAFLIADVVVSDNGGEGMQIVHSGGVTGVLQGTLDRVSLHHNGFGSSCCGTGGIRAAIGSTRISITNSAVTNNNHIGIDTDDGPTIRLAHSVVTGNDAGVNAGSGTVDSAGDNYIDGNGTNITGTLIHVGTQ